MRAISFCAEARVLSGIGGRLAISIRINYITGRRTVPNPQKESGPCQAASLKTNFPCYFGGGVVVVPEDFLLFLPPLWPFLPDLVFVGVLAVAAFLPGGVGCGFVAPLSPPVCAMTRPAPRSNVITNVEIFFIRFSDQIFSGSYCGSLPESRHWLAGTFCHLLTRVARDSFFVAAGCSYLIEKAPHRLLGLNCFSNKKRRPFPGRLWNPFLSYFGGGVVDEEPFLDFLPPLWAFFPDLVVVLSPEVAVLSPPVVLPPVLPPV